MEIINYKYKYNREYDADLLSFAKANSNDYIYIIDENLEVSGGHEKITNKELLSCCSYLCSVYNKKQRHSKGQRVLRGVPNAFPIYTSVSSKKQFTDDDETYWFFKVMLDNSIDKIQSNHFDRTIIIPEDGFGGNAQLNYRFANELKNSLNSAFNLHLNIEKNGKYYKAC